MKHTRLALFILALVVIVVTFALCNKSVKEAESQEISFPQSRGGGVLTPIGLGKVNLVRVNGAWSTLDEDNTLFWTMGNDASREMLNLAHETRIRMTGNIEQIEIKHPNAEPQDTIIVKFWRHQAGTVYRLVGISENLASGGPGVGWPARTDTIVRDATTTITLNTPIHVKRGDLHSIRYAEITTNNRALAFSDNVTYQNGSDSRTGHVGAIWYWAASDGAFPVPAGDFNWETQGHAVPVYHSVNRVNFYMKAPQVVIFGASINAGHNANWSFYEISELDSVAEDTWLDTSKVDLGSTIAFYLSSLTGWTYQNTAIGSETANIQLNDITERVTALHPRLVIMGTSSNDIDTSGTAVPLQVILDWHIEMFDTLNTRGIKMLYRPFIPRDNANWTLGNNRRADSLMTSLEIAVREHACDCTWLELRSKLGLNDNASTARPPGNRWDLNGTFDGGDNIHLNPTAHSLIADEIFERLSRP